MEEKRPTLLIVEDDLDIAEMLNAYFRVQNYRVLHCELGEDALRQAEESHPDLVILDIRLPDIDGFEVARRLRANRKTQNLPVIFLTEKRERLDRLRGLELRAEDYITKPFDIQELRLKVRNALARSRQGSLTNPITGLPMGVVLEEQYTRCLTQPDWGILAVSIANVIPFREQYGFVASDDLLRAVGVILQDTLREYNVDGFLGQYAMADFLIFCNPGAAAQIKPAIKKRLEQSFDYFYTEEDRAAGIDSRQKLKVVLGELSHSTASVANAGELKTKVAQLLRQGHI